MEEELLDTYDIKGNFLGVQSREFCHSKNPKCYHKAVYIWIKNNKGQILVQQKGLNKKHCPGKWDMPVAGHVKAGEKEMDACVRETKEELGLVLSPKSFKLIGKFLYEEGHQFCEIFCVKKELNLQKIKIQQDEVAQVKWLDFSEFIKLLYSNEFASHPIEYKNLVARILNN